MIDHFSGYGFNKSHSCGYAYIAFQTAYLKSTYPVDYMAALLTSVKDKQDRTALYLAECRTMGITVDPPDVNLSASDYTPLPPVEGKPGEIRIGLSAIRNVGENVVAEIIREREKKGPFGSFADFCHRVDPTALNKRVVESFVKAGAFDSLGLSRGDFLTWGTDTRTGEQKLVLSDAAATMLDAAATYRRNEDAGQSSLFSAETHHTLVDPAPSGADIPRAALLAAEKEMLGLYVSEHPLLEVEKALRASTDTQIADIAMVPEGSVRSIGGIISRFAKKFTKKGEAMGIITLEDLAGAVEVVVFPAAFQKFGPLAGTRLDHLRQREDRSARGRAEGRGAGGLAAEPGGRRRSARSDGGRGSVHAEARGGAQGDPAFASRASRRCISGSCREPIRRCCGSPTRSGSSAVTASTRS